MQFVCKLLLAAACAACAFGQPSVNLLAAVPTQAVVSIGGYSGSCSLALSGSPLYAPVHPDVNGAEYPGADTDTGRPDTYTWADGTRIVTLGHENADRALQTATTYYLNVSGCGGSATLQFTTPTIGLGSTHTMPPPFNAAKWANLDLPPFDWTRRNVHYVDPTTGVDVTLSNPAGDFTWRCCLQPFTNYTGGADWTNPAGILSGGSTYATASTTTTIDIYAPSQPWARPWSLPTLDDIGVQVFGSGSSDTDADRQIAFCIFKNPNAGCYSNTITVTLPKFDGAHAAPLAPSTSGDADGVWPNTFPTPLFGGDWGGAILRQSDMTSSGHLNASSGVLTVADPSAASNFSTALGTAGYRIFVDGASQCAPAGMCTIAALGNALNAQTVENVSASNAAYTAFGWGIRVQKRNSKGTVNVGLQLKLAGSRNSRAEANPGSCTPPVTSGDGKSGVACNTWGDTTSRDSLYFFADDGTVRRLSNWNYSGNWGATPLEDRPAGGPKASLSLKFSDSSGNWYLGLPCANGGACLYRLSYSGDYTEDIDYGYNGTQDGNMPSTPSDRFTWTNVTPPSAGMDLDSQISAAFPTYNASLYGSWLRNGSFRGVSGKYAIFLNAYSGQDGGPAWIAVLDISKTPATVVNLIHTLDGTGTNGALRWAAQHSAGALGIVNGMFFAANALGYQNHGGLNGGPFEVQVVGVLRHGVFDTSNTALPWPPTAQDNGGYDTACPGDIAATLQSLGATGDNCVTLEVYGDPCNVNATSADQSHFPACVWNSKYTSPIPLAIGDNLFDINSAIYPASDGEHFKVVKITRLVGGYYLLVLQRNAAFDYCCMPDGNARTSSCVDSVPQFTHGNGWNLAVAPGSKNTCSSATYFYRFDSNTFSELAHPFALHWAFGPGAAPGAYSMDAGPALLSNLPFNQLDTVPTPFFAVSQFPVFGGYSNNGTLQSYPAMGPNGLWFTDTNLLSPAGEIMVNSFGVPRALTPMAGNIYKIQALGNPLNPMTYKTLGLVGWAGRFLMRDVSGPASSSVNALANTPYSFCYALVDGECYASSTAGETYTNVPYAYDPGFCVTSLSWANVPCVYSADAGLGGFRQHGATAADTTSATDRVISHVFEVPGSGFAFLGGGATATGNRAIVDGGPFIDGVRVSELSIGLPPWQPDTVARNQFVPYPFTVSNGGTYAEVRWGYNNPMMGLPTQFYCTARQEYCDTSSDTQNGVPYVFASEPRTSNLISCSGGCTIAVPLLAGHIAFAQVFTSDDGVSWTAQGDVIPIAAP